MNVPRWLNPKTNPALYTALASIALSVWQAVQVDFWAGSLTLPEVGRVAAPIVIAALVAWQRRKTTPLADPRDGNDQPLLTANQHAAENFRRALERGGDAVPLSDPERRRAENLRLTHAPGTPSFYPYPGEPPAAAQPPTASAP